MSEEIPIRYAISIAFHEDNYHGIIYCPHNNEYSSCSNPNLTKLMGIVSKRIKKKEREVTNFPLPQELDQSRIILPNGA